MKRIIPFIIAMLSIVLVIPMPVQAADFDLVADGVGVLTEAEYIELNELAQEITDRYQCEVSIVLLEDKGHDDAIDTAKFIYNEYAYGYGEDKSGLMLLISMKERDYATLAYGYGNTAFTDHGKDVLVDQHLLPMLAEDDYYSAFLSYLGKTGEFLEMAENGTPFDTSLSPWIKWAIVVFAPLLIAGIICFMFLSQMKTAVAERAADSYVLAGGVNLTMQADQFLYTTETRTQIKKESSSGGTSVDSDGSSSSQGKF